MSGVEVGMSYFPETGSPVFGEGSSHGSPSHPFRGDDADVGEFSLDPEREWFLELSFLLVILQVNVLKFLF